MLKIVADEAIPYIKGVLEPNADIIYLPGTRIDRTAVKDADAVLVRTRTVCDRDLLEGSAVKVIATATIGFDHIDISYCNEAGIRVCTAAGCNAYAVLQWFGAVMAHTSAAGGWHPAEKRLGVVGVGHVGSILARYASAWGFDVMCCDPPRERRGEQPPEGERFHTYCEVLRNCDIISYHTPLTVSGEDATYHLLGPDETALLKKGSLVLNASRGAVVDTAALNNAILMGDCSAVIDTWENEPHIDRELLSNAILATPHVAGYSAQGKANASSMSVRSIAAFFGLPLTDWYPVEVPRINHRIIPWEEMCTTIRSYYDIDAESRMLKEDPAGLEKFRTGYRYRQEYF